MTQEQVEFINYAKQQNKKSINIMKKYSFSIFELQQILQAENDGLTMEEISTFANPKYSSDQMKKMRMEIPIKKQLIADCLRKNYNSISLIECEKFTIEQIQQIIDAEKRGLNIREILKIANPTYSVTEMKKLKENLIDSKRHRFFVTECINNAGKRGFTEKEILELAYTKYPPNSPNEMQIYLKKLLIGKISNKSYKSLPLLEQHIFTTDQLEQILQAENDGLTEKEISDILNPKYSPIEMKKIRLETVNKKKKIENRTIE